MEEDGTLSIGTRLGEFEIRGLVGVGGFGIVYRAFDHDLEREVAIKEYMPGLLASRTVGGQVQARGRTHAETFEAGRRSFMLEAKMLARFDHPALVKVFRFWEGNGTAYMVMPLYTGQTLAQALKQLPGPPTETWLMGVLVPLLGALEALHSQQIFHRDVAPDNILLLRNGRPVLLDFGAARQVISDRTQTLTAILKPNYAPIEQYAEVPNLRQGPWTDLYALGAVVYASLTGKPPPPAAARTVQDDLVPLVDVAARLEAEHGLHYSATFLGAWQQTLAVRPNERPQSVQALLERLGLMPSVLVDDDRTVLAPTTRPPLRPADQDHTVVVTGLPSLNQGLLAVSPATEAPPSVTPATTRTATVPTGRDMRLVPPVTGVQPAGSTAPPTGHAATGATLPPVGSPEPGASTRPPAPTPPPARPDNTLPADPAPRNGKVVQVLALVGVVVVAVLGYLLTRGPSGDAHSAAPAAPAASAALAASASASAASQPALVIIDEEPERPPAAGASAPTLAAQPASAVSPLDKAAQAAAAKASAAAAKASAAAAKAAARNAAAQTPPATTTPAPADAAPTPAPAPVASRAATPAAPSAPSPAPARTLDDLCGKRIFIAREMCIQDACQTAEFSRTATCVELRRKAEEERQRKIHTDG